MQPKLSQGILYLMQQGKYEEAHLHATFLIEEAKRKQNIELEFAARVQRMRLAFQQHDIECAAHDLTVCEQLLHVSDTVEPYKAMFHCASAVLHTLTNNKALAMTHFEMAISLGYEHEDWQIVSIAYARLSMLTFTTHGFDKAFPYAKTALLFAKMTPSPLCELYAIRARIAMLYLLLHGQHLEQASRLYTTLQKTLQPTDLHYETLHVEIIWLHHAFNEKRYHDVLKVSDTLLQAALLHKHYDLSLTLFDILIATYEQLNDPVLIDVYTVQRESIVQHLYAQAHIEPVQQLCPMPAPSNKEFQEVAQKHLHAQTEGALLLVSIYSNDILSTEQLQNVKQTLHEQFEQLPFRVTNCIQFEQQKLLYLASAPFKDAAIPLQNAIDATLSAHDLPITILFGYTHNQEHQSYTFHECLALCHAYLYYNQWALEAYPTNALT